MNTPALRDEVLMEAVRAMEENDYKVNICAKLLNLPRSTLQHRLRLAEERGLKPARPNPIGSEIHIAPEPKEDAEDAIRELVERKKARMSKSLEREKWEHLIPVQVKEERPIGLFLVGDPHIDDDYCDIGSLERDLTTVGKTPGFFAGHIGDLTNNWVGRLQRLYANQSTRFDEGLKLTEWMLGLAPNLFVVGGNHDCWEKGMDLLRFIVRQGTTGHLQAHGARMALRWPSGKEIRIHARHNFSGKSQYSDTHGMKRELLWGHRDHVLVAGHLHIDEARIEPSLDGDAHWLFRVSGYKLIDEYAKENNFKSKRLAPGVALVIDPSQPVPAERIKPFWDVERAAAYLTWIRK
jgi:hypothetical protein